MEDGRVRCGWRTGFADNDVPCRVPVGAALLATQAAYGTTGDTEDQQWTAAFHAAKR